MNKCIGVDYKIHVCKPNDTETACSLKIKRKKVLPFDITNKHWCPECDVILEKEIRHEDIRTSSSNR